MQLAHALEQVRALADARVEGRALVRVLAVAQVHHLLVRIPPRRREALVGAHRKPRRDGRVVASRARERLCGELGARGAAEAALAAAQLREHGLVIARVDDDRREGAVLGRRPDHCRAADVDVLDDQRLIGVLSRGCALEGVEVHAHQIDLLDPLLGGRIEVRVLVASGQETRVEARVKRLDAPVHDLGKAREVLDRARDHAPSLELARGAAG